jgi:hypothetical protein
MNKNRYICSTIGSESEDTATGDAQDAEDGSVHPSIKLPQDTQTWFAPIVPTKPEIKTSSVSAASKRRCRRFPH